MSLVTGITQPFIISLSYLYSTCGWSRFGGVRAGIFGVIESWSQMNRGAHIALLQRVLGSINEVGSVSRPDPLVLGLLVLLLVVKLQMKFTGIVFIFLFSVSFLIFFPIPSLKQLTLLMFL